MHIARSGPTWKEFIELLYEHEATFSADVIVTVDNRQIVKTCRFPTPLYRELIRMLQTQHGRLPGYVTVQCDQSL